MVSGIVDYDRQVLESALEWWRDAGVDMVVENSPRDWFARTAPAPLSAPSRSTSLARPAEPVLDAPLPSDWDAFLAWRGGADAPEARWMGGGVLASGPVDSAVMVLADLPDREDCEAGALLTGEAGRLFDRMLAAIGLDRGRVHLASVCSKRPVTGRVSRTDDARLGEIARHHVSLIGPRRLLLMGDAASRAVTGVNVIEARGRLHPIGHKDATTEAVASFHPRLLLERPALKREAWADLRLLMRGLG